MNLSHEQDRPRAELLGLPFDAITMNSAVARCMAWCAGPRGAHTVITANAAILCMMRRDSELKKACIAGDLILPDGMSVVWASRLLGGPFPERVSGVDLMARLVSEAAERQLSAYFLGARHEVVSKLVDICAQRCPGLKVAGWRDGYFSAPDHIAIVDDIRERAPHLLFIGMPSPFKETWCERHRERLNVPVIMGVGGSFDVLAGYVRRAPHSVQAMGMEWAWRLAMEPRKMWRRYLSTNTEFLWLITREIASCRSRRAAAHRIAKLSEGPSERA
jgi:N-acetylglucosaminyldiphosphoundecaprenol N-acetyl-beta-D-mannosaminyltransferase